MKTRIILISVGILLLLLLGFAMKSCTSVPAGNVGVKVNLYGSSKGVDNQVLPTGRYWLSWNEEMYLFPTFQQTYVFTKGNDEGKETDESFSFQTKEGLVVFADIGITFHVESSKAAVLFQTYRKGISEIIDGPIRGIIRDGFNKEASTVPVEYAYGEGKSKLLDSVQKYVRQYFMQYGIIIDRLYLVGSFRLPQNVVNALNSKIEATQKAAQYENEVAQATAEAKKKVAYAQGDSASAVIRASGEAAAMKLKLQNLSPALIEYEKAKRWDGKLPQVTGGSIPMIQLPSK